MNVSTHPDKSALARAAAAAIVASARRAIAERGHFTLALSGGSTPWAMLENLAEKDLDWSAVHIYQVDERRAPDGDAARNWTQLEKSFFDSTGIPEQNRHAMPVNSLDVSADQYSAEHYSAEQYSAELKSAAGDPIVLDLVQLGLGSDGHTASLVPGDAVLGVTDRDVAWTDDYRGHRRMTLTYPTINQAREILWLVTGAGKQDAVAQLVAADHAIPAGAIAQEQATLYVDHAAAEKIAN